MVPKPISLILGSNRVYRNAPCYDCIFTWIDQTEMNLNSCVDQHKEANIKFKYQENILVVNTSLCWIRKYVLIEPKSWRLRKNTRNNILQKVDLSLKNRMS